MQPNSSDFQDKTEKNALKQIPQLVGKPLEGRDSVPHMLGVHELLSIDQRTFPPILDIAKWQHREKLKDNLSTRCRG